MQSISFVEWFQAVIWSFRPSAPLPLSLKVICERRFARATWLLGPGHSTSEAIPAPSDIDAILASCDEAALPQRLFDFLGTRLPVPDPAVSVLWGTEESMTDQSLMCELIRADDDGRVREIRIHPMFGGYPYRLAAVTASAIAVWIVQVRAPNNELDGVPETIPLLCGLGPIMANATLYELSESSFRRESAARHRIGTVSAIEFGYMMALTDCTLGTDYLSVRSTLRLDAREGLRKGHRFLRKTSDTCLPLGFPEVRPDMSPTAVAGRLRAGSVSTQVGTLLDLREAESIDDSLIEVLVDLLRHTEPEVQQLAASSLQGFDPLPEIAHSELLGFVQNGTAPLRQAALVSLKPGSGNDSDAVRAMSTLLSRADFETATICIQALLRYDSYPDCLTESLVRALSMMIHSANADQIRPALDLLDRVVRDVSETLQRCFGDDPTALAILQEAFQMQGHSSMVGDEDDYTASNPG